MSKYKLIIEYYLKGNNRTQIATLCDCSRMTVWRVLQRVNAIGIGLDELNGMSEKERLLPRSLRSAIKKRYMKKNYDSLLTSPMSSVHH